jgi:Homeodomain-like domain
MRLPASEKLEIIRLVEQSHLPARRTLQMLGIKPSTFYRWYDRYRSSGLEALEDKLSKPDRVWNRIPDDIRQRVVMMAFEQPELSPRELATGFTHTNSYYVSESSVYRLEADQNVAGRAMARTTLVQLICSGWLHSGPVVLSLRSAPWTSARLLRKFQK